MRRSPATRRPAVTAVVDETPTGPLAACSLTAYISLDRFERMMRAPVAAERISCRGDRYFPIRATAQSDSR
jgi:hypothetical protein